MYSQNQAGAQKRLSESNALKERWMDQSREEPSVVNRFAAVKPEGGTFVNALSQLPLQVASE